MTRFLEVHIQVHNYYREIYDIYFVMPEKRSLLHKIVTFSSKNVSTEDKEKAAEAYKLLEKTSAQLIELLEDLKTVLYK